jgi:multidrug efflux pump subunit AcrA (membrane-fusion protein)
VKESSEDYLFRGRGESIEAAASAAVRDAEDRGLLAPPTTLEIVQIKVTVENPITDYIVVLTT